MGKLKRNRNNKKARNDPLKGKSAHQDGQKDESIRQSKILPLIEKLKSTVPNDKSMALGAITLLCEDTKLRKLFLKDGIIALVMERCLNDSNDEIVVESYGLLRNLGIEEGYSVVKNYWRSDIWTAIEAALQQIKKSFQYLSDERNIEQKQDRTKVQLLYDFTENVLSLIIAIAGGSDDLCQSVLARIDPVLDFVMDLLNWNIGQDQINKKFFNSLLEFIYELATESVEVIKTIITSKKFSIEKITACLASPNQSTNRLGKTYFVGITFNLNEFSSEGSERFDLSRSLLDQIFEIFSGLDLNEIKEQLILKDNSGTSNSSSEKDKENDPKKEELKKYQAKSDLNGIEISLDIITTILEYLSSPDDQEESLNSLPADLNKTLLGRIYPFLIELMRFDYENQSILLLTEKILISFNNLCLFFLTNQSIPTGWYDKCLELWSILIRLSSNDNLMIQKLCLDVMWAIAKSLGPEVETQIDSNMVTSLIGKCNLTLEEINKDETFENQELIQFYSSLLGFLGAVVPHKSTISDIKEFSTLIYSTIEVFSKKLNNESNVRIIVDCVNIIFELFADKDFYYDNEVFVQNDYISKLTLLEPLIKKMYKGVDKNKNRMLKLQGEEVWINLGRFIQYKKDERPEIYSK